MPENGSNRLRRIFRVYNPSPRQRSVPGCRRSDASRRSPPRIMPRPPADGTGLLTARRQAGFRDLRRLPRLYARRHRRVAVGRIRRLGVAVGAALVGSRRLSSRDRTGPRGPSGRGPRRRKASAETTCSLVPGHFGRAIKVDAKCRPTRTVGRQALPELLPSSRGRRRPSDFRDCWQPRKGHVLEVIH
jgi:hypothetical protein